MAQPRERMEPLQRYAADVIVVGAGIAGVTAALELLDRGRRVLLIDRDT
jgi:glycine/D-amino acid oxidase-like deaminating enzyme